MKHVDEGTLQLWLDRSRSGMSAQEAARIEAHLAECAACAGRLEALEADTRRVEALLSVPFPDDDELPDFAEVRARAEATGRVEKGGGGRGWQPALWAASVVLALGVGWMANEVRQRVPDPGLVQQSPAATERRQAESEADPAAGAEAAAPTATEPALEARAAQGGGADADLPDRVARPATPVAEVAAGEGERVEPAPAEEDRVAAADEDRAAVAQEERAAPAAVPADAVGDALADAPQGARPAVVRGRVTDEAGRPLESAQVYVADAAVGTLTRADGSFELALDDLPADSATGEVALTAELLGYQSARSTLALKAGDSVSADLRLPAQALSLEALVVTGQPAPEERRAAERAAEPVAELEPSAGGAARAEAERLARERAFADRAGWQPSDLAEAEARLGFRPWTVEGLPLARVETADTESGPLARVVHTLEGDATLELVQAAADTPAAAALEVDGTLARVVRLDGVVIGARGALAPEALAALLERLTR